MKSIASITAAFVAAIAGLGVAPAALAGGKAITTPGSACALQSAPSQEGLLAITLTQRGVANKDPLVDRDVVCPVVRSGEGAELVVFVDGELEPNARMACRVQSRRVNGDLLAQKSFSTTRAKFDIPAAFKFAEAPQFSYQVVLCRLPANSQGRILGVTSLEF